MGRIMSTFITSLKLDGVTECNRRLFVSSEIEFKPNSGYHYEIIIGGMMLSLFIGLFVLFVFRAKGYKNAKKEVPQIEEAEKCSNDLEASQ